MDEVDKAMLTCAVVIALVLAIVGAAAALEYYFDGGAAAACVSGGFASLAAWGLTALRRASKKRQR